MMAPCTESVPGVGRHGACARARARATACDAAFTSESWFCTVFLAHVFFVDRRRSSRCLLQDSGFCSCRAVADDVSQISPFRIRR